MLPFFLVAHLAILEQSDIGQVHWSASLRSVAKQGSKKEHCPTDIAQKSRDEHCEKLVLLEKQGGLEQFIDFIALGRSRRKRGECSKRTRDTRLTRLGADEERYQSILRKCKPERLLRVKRVKPVTLLRYSDHVDDFVLWCRRHQKSANTCRLADKALSVYMNVLFEDGATLTSAGYTLFGFIALKTVPDKAERDMMPLARCALTAWRRSKHGTSRVGVPPQVIYHFAKFCVEAGIVNAATYARPSEILQLRGRDLVRSVPAFATQCGVLFGNSEFGETSKAGVSDDVVLADSPHRPWAHRILQKLIRRFAGDDVLLFDILLAKYEELFRKFSAKHGLDQLCLLLTPVDTVAHRIRCHACTSYI